MTNRPNAAQANVNGATFDLSTTRLEDSMSTLDKINATLANGTTDKTETTQGKRGFSVPKGSAKAKADAKAWVAQYDRGIANGKYPRVGFSASSANFLPMVIVAMIPGFTSEADAIAKVRAVQVALGVRPTDRNNLGLKAMASPSAISREKTMRSLAADWIAKADAKGVYRLQPTRPAERVAVKAIRPESTRNTKGKTSAKAKVAKASTRDTSRSNGAVKVTVDKALRSAAAKAERATQRAANRAKVLAEKNAANAKAQAQADGA